MPPPTTPQGFVELLLAGRLTNPKLSLAQPRLILSLFLSLFFAHDAAVQESRWRSSLARISPPLPQSSDRTTNGRTKRRRRKQQYCNGTPESDSLPSGARTHARFVVNDEEGILTRKNFLPSPPRDTRPSGCAAAALRNQSWPPVRLCVCMSAWREEEAQNNDLGV